MYSNITMKHTVRDGILVVQENNKNTYVFVKLNNRQNIVLNML